MIKGTCRCGTDYGTHPSEFTYLNIKEYCVSCGDYIRNSTKRYEDRGNWCLVCNGRANHNSLFNR